MLSVVHGGITCDVYVTSRVTSCREKVQSLVPIWHCACTVGAVGRHIGIRVRQFFLFFYWSFIFFALFCFVVLPCVLHLHCCGIFMRHNKSPYFKPGLQCCCNLHISCWSGGTSGELDQYCDCWCPGAPFTNLIGQLHVCVSVIKYITILTNWHAIRSIVYYSDVITRAMASQITGVLMVYSIVCSGAVRRKQQSSASLAFVGKFTGDRRNSSHKGPVTQKMFPFHDVTMFLQNSAQMLASRLFVFSPGHRAVSAPVVWWVGARALTRG